MIKQFLLITILFLVCIIVMGCFSSRPGDIMYFRKPYEVETTANKYIMQPPDEVEVFCDQFAKINQQKQRIRPDGKISFEDIGDIPAAGLTPEELAKNIRLKINDFYKLTGENPVDVKISVYQSKFYYVLGQVNDPGPKLFSGRDTVLTAVSRADPNPMAWLEKVQVIRPSRNSNVRPAIFELNYKRLTEHGDAVNNVLLQEGDIVYIPPTVLGWAALKIEEFIRPIARAFTGAYIVRHGADSNSYYNY